MDFILIIDVTNFVIKIFKSRLEWGVETGVLILNDRDFIICLCGFQFQGQVRHQGEHESLHRDIILAFGRWEFSPLDLENPFSNKEGWVHSWQGDEDLIVPVKVERYIAQKLLWIQWASRFWPFVPSSWWYQWYHC